MLQKEDPEHGWDLIHEGEMLICDTEVLPCLCVTGGKSLRTQGHCSLPGGLGCEMHYDHKGAAEARDVYRRL